MKVEIKIDENCPVPKLVIYTKEITPDISELVKKLSKTQRSNIIGYKNDKLEFLHIDEIIRIYGEQQKVFAQTEKGVYSLRLRLYEMEEKLVASHFIRISNSEIINLKKVKNLDMSYNGTICINFQSGGETYVSRRYVSKIKDYLGI